jgi:hypothetical protein
MYTPSPLVEVPVRLMRCESVVTLEPLIRTALLATEPAVAEIDPAEELTEIP